MEMLVRSCSFLLVPFFFLPPLFFPLDLLFWSGTALCASRGRCDGGRRVMNGGGGGGRDGRGAATGEVSVTVTVGVLG